MPIRKPSYFCVKGPAMPALFRVSCLLLTFCVIAGLASSAWADSGKPQHIEIVQTFEPSRNNGTPLVQVRFSNTVIGTFAIDTGEYESVLTEDFAKRAGLKLTADKNLRFIFGLFPKMVVQIPEIKLDNLTVTGQTFHVVSQEFLPLFGDRPIDGLLGGDLLSRFALKIDYPAHEIAWITPGNLSTESVAELGFTRQNLIELGQERTPWQDKVNHYSIRADFQNGDRKTSEDLWIDTGSYDTLVSNMLADELKLAPIRTEMTGTLSDSLAPVNRCSVAKMQIGPLALSDVSVVAPQRKDSGFPSLLGENVLSNCVVLLDFGPHHFYLRPVLPPTKADSAAPLDKTQILWDRLRSAPDLPTIEEVLDSGFAPDAQDDLGERVARLQTPLADTTNEIERLEKLGALRREGQDEAGAKAALTEAVTKAAAYAQAHPDDGPAARQWVEALTQAERYDEAIAAAMQTTVRLPSYSPGWRFLGSVLTAQVLFIQSGRQEEITERKLLKETRPVHDGLPTLTPAQSVQIQSLLVQAHMAFDKSIVLAPAEAESYRERALFRFVSRSTLTALQQAKLKVDLPPTEVPSDETALALMLADLQQCILLSPNDTERLSVAASFDRYFPVFHDRRWLTDHLKGTGYVLPTTLMTVEAAQARLSLLTKSEDKSMAVSAWTELGGVQAEQKGTTSEAESEASWRQALTLDPTHSEALTRLAASLYHHEHWADLRDLLTHQIALSESVPTRLALAAVLSAENLPIDAEAQVRAAKVLAPDNATVNLTLADLLLARSSGDPAALSEAAVCLGKAQAGYGKLATAEQKATLTTSQAVWLALDHDPDAAEKQLVALAKAEPTCTQAREALAALIPYQ